jgi:hypothetical protein
VPLPASLGHFKLVKNKFYVTDQPTDANEVQKLASAVLKSMIADNQKKRIYVLSGTHGDAKGNLVPEKHFWWKEDKNLEHQLLLAVNVWNFTQPGKISKNSWNKYLGGNAVVILAWCYSQQSIGGWMKTEGLKV